MTSLLHVQDSQFMKVVVYDVSDGWTSLLDYFTLDVSSSTTNSELSLVGARPAYNTTYVCDNKRLS